MQFVLCDDDALLRSMVEAVVSRHGHDIAGVADTTVAGAQLVLAARPDVVVLDLSLGTNTDFDVIEAAGQVGATTIVFSHNADHRVLDRYDERPLVVPKPDLAGLEDLIARLGEPNGNGASDVTATADRRVRPTRAAAGPVPTGVGDASAFYEALNNAVEGDTLLSIELGPSGSADWEAAGTRVAALIRATDRLLASPTSVRVYLAGGETDGAESLVERLHGQGTVPEEWAIRSIVVDAGEAPADAFDRLKRAS
jgi:chemotaxis response regulator CheB